jgi:hypothetical protein
MPNPWGQTYALTPTEGEPLQRGVHVPAPADKRLSDSGSPLPKAARKLAALDKVRNAVAKVLAGVGARYTIMISYANVGERMQDRATQLDLTNVWTLCAGPVLRPFGDLSGQSSPRKLAVKAMSQQGMPVAGSLRLGHHTTGWFWSSLRGLVLRLCGDVSGQSA